MKQLFTGGAAVLVALTSLLCGCARKDVVPMPGRMNSEGFLLKTQEIPLGGGFLLQRRQILRSWLWNDFYPLNVPSAKPVEDIVSRLYVVDAMEKNVVDWAYLPDVGRHRSPKVSPDGERIVFDRPEVLVSRDTEYPQAQPRDVRPCVVAVYSKPVGRVILFEQLSGVEAVSHANLWRPACDWAAFSSFTLTDEAEVYGLVIASYGGELLASPASDAALAGLEFIAWSPDGEKIAALRPARPRSGGEGGGELVEFTLADKTLRSVSAVPGELAANHLQEFQELIDWPQGHLALSPPQ